MMNRAIRLGSVLSLLVCLPAFAGTVYVPWAGSVNIGGETFTTEISATNTAQEGDAPLRIKFFRADTDGTLNDTEPDEYFVRPGKTKIIEVSGERGLLEIDAADQIGLTARLANSVGKGAQLPIITADNINAADATTMVQGWERWADGNTTYTDFGLINLGDAEAMCTVDVFRVGGAVVSDTFTLAVFPKSFRPFPRALDILGQDQLAGVTSKVSCDQPFSATVLLGFPQAKGVVALAATTFGSSGFESAGGGSGGGGGTGGGGGSGDFVHFSDVPWAGVSSVMHGPFKDRAGFDPHGGPGGTAVAGHKNFFKLNGTTYNKGVFWVPDWSKNSTVTWNLNGQYTRFTALVGWDDEVDGAYEWGVINSGGRFLFLQRPSDGYRGREVNPNGPMRIGANGTLKIYTDGNLVHQTPDMHWWSGPESLDINLTGVNELRIILDIAGWEERNAPHRNGFSRRVFVTNNSWFNNLNIVEGKLYQ